MTMHIGSGLHLQAAPRESSPECPERPEPDPYWVDHGWALTARETAGIVAAIIVASVACSMLG